MLDLAHGVELNDEAFGPIVLHAELPCPPEEFFGLSGAVLLYGDSRRQYHRFYLREHVAMVRRGEAYGIYIKDASRKGIGFLSPIQLFPRDLVIAALPEFGALKLSVRRCRRLAPQCYDCGSIFAEGLLSPTAYKELMDRQRTGGVGSGYSDRRAIGR